MESDGDGEARKLGTIGNDRRGERKAVQGKTHEAEGGHLLMQGRLFYITTYCM